MSDFVAGTDLSPGKLYVAAGRVPRRLIRSEANLLGPTRGGVRLTYQKKSDGARRRNGDTVGSIGTSGTVRLRGTLAHVTPDAVCRLLGELGGTVSPDGNVAIARFPGADAGMITVCLVCPSEKGESVFYSVCSSADELDLDLGSCGKDGIAFSLTAVCGDRSPSLSFIHGGEAV